jgi:K+-sensing histidine kinase KdpD
MQPKTTANTASRAGAKKPSKYFPKFAFCTIFIIAVITGMWVKNIEYEASPKKIKRSGIFGESLRSIEVAAMINRAASIPKVVMRSNHMFRNPRSSPKITHPKFAIPNNIHLYLAILIVIFNHNIRSQAAQNKF